jgi:non-specific serine/threonine protein kinase
VERADGQQRRYRLLDSVRDYAFARLAGQGDADQLRDRHFAYFHGELKGSLPALLHGEQISCLARLRRERQNVRAALDWGLTSTELRENAVELVAALVWYWIKSALFAEGRSWLERALAAEPFGPRRGLLAVFVCPRAGVRMSRWDQ